MTRADIAEAARMLCPVDQDVVEVHRNGTPRWFFPIGNSRTLRNSVELYPAFRSRSRVYRAALLAWASVGGVRLTHRIQPKRGGEWSLGQLLVADFPALATAAVSVGTPGPTQKLTVQLMDGSGHTLGFAKYAITPEARACLANEARMLPLLPENVGPRLVRSTRFLGGDLLVQTPLPGRVRMPRSQPDAAHVRLIQHLIRPGRTYAAPEHPFLANLYLRAGSRKALIDKVVSDLQDSEWAVAWHHGDLSPWNMRWNGGACRAFDWEHGANDGFAFMEIAHAPIQVAGLARKTHPLRAKRLVSQYVADALPEQRARFAPALTALSALTTLVSWYPPRESDAFARWLTTFIEANPEI